VAQGWSAGGCSHFITAPLCCSFLLTFFPCSSVGPLYRLQFLSRKYVLMWALHRLRFLQEHLSAPAWFCPWTAVTICTGVTSPQAAGNLCSGTWSTSSPLSCFPDLGVLSTVSRSFLFSLFPLPLSLWCFLSFLTCIFPDTPLTLVVDSAPTCNGTGCDWPRAARSPFPQKPPLQPSCCQYLATYTESTAVYFKACRVTGKVK